jgi:uncharacterized phiE125 gp8 family phage protein
MAWSIKRTVEPVKEPVDIELFKKSVHISFNEQDDVLTSYLKAGRVAAEDFQGRSYITQGWDIVLDSFPSGEICLLRGPVQTLDSVVITDVNGDETPMDVSDFIVLTDNTPARMLLRSTASWPSVTLQDIGGIRIRYTAGYGLEPENVPADIKHAIIIFASFADDNRGVEDDMTPQSFFNLLEPTRIYTEKPV